jgi:hypothetical protein
VTTVLSSPVGDRLRTRIPEFELPSLDVGGIGIPGVPANTIWRASGLQVSHGPRHVYFCGDLGP